MNNLIDKFVDYIRIERHYSELTVAAYERDLCEFRAFVESLEKPFELKSLDADDIRNWLISLMDKGESPRSVRRKLSSLRSYWKFCLRIGLVDSDVTRKIILPKVDKPLPVFYKDSEMQRLAETASSEMNPDDINEVRDLLVIEMLYETGMRRAEILGLEDKDIDLKQGQIRVFGKRRKERIVPIGENLQEQIRHYMTLRDEKWGSNEKFLLQEKRNGEVMPMTINKIYNIVRARMSEVSTLHKQSPHVLRHTFATTMLNNGADINTIKSLLGHANLAATQVYTHTTFEQIKQSYNQAHPRAVKERRNHES